MYIPDKFRFEDHQELLAFMRRYPFAVMVTPCNGVSVATHLPLVIGEDGERIILSGHFAAANPQIQHIGQETSLVVFSGPHAYISPRHYERFESVPTWDYLDVHAYGICRVAKDVDAKLKLLEKMIAFYEPDYMDQWASLPSGFKTSMSDGVVAFSMDVTDLQGQQKLSQNKTPAERLRI